MGCELDVSGYPGTLALAAALLGVAGGVAVLWAAVASYHRYRVVAGLASVLLIATTLGVLVRATDRPFYGIQADGRLQALSHIASHAQRGDGVVSVVPYLYELSMDRYSELPPVYGLLRTQRIHPETHGLVDNAVARHKRLWYLSVWTFPGDPGKEIEHWLTEATFSLESWEFGGYRVGLYSSPVETELDIPIDAVFSDAISLERMALSHVSDSSRVLQVTLDWHALRAVETDYQVFLHIYDSDGNLVDQADHAPVGVSTPTSLWVRGERVRDRIALQLTGGGDGYRLAVGLYDWRTGERVPARAGSEAVDVIDDAVCLSPGMWNE